MLEPNTNGPKYKDKYLVKWYQDMQWNQMHFDTLELAVSKIKALECSNLIWSLVPVEI